LCISFLVISSTSLPSGAFVTKSTSTCALSSLMMMSPPLSPSTKRVTVFALHTSRMVGTMTVPFMPMTFLKPFLSRFKTSARPSTMMTSSLSSMVGPAGHRSLPYSVISMTRMACDTSSVSSWLSGKTLSVKVFKSSFARSMTKVLLLMRTSSIFSTLTFALQGPMRCIVSSAAAMMAVSALSKELGIMIFPVAFPARGSSRTSMRAILPDRCSSRSSRSSPRSPSVCPNMAPITSGRSTSPSMVMLALMMYFDDTGLIFPMVIPSGVIFFFSGTSF